MAWKRPKTVVSDELANEWRTAYESGLGHYDIVALEAAKGRATSWTIIRREIERVGGKIRSFQESMDMRNKKAKEKFSND